MISDDAIATGFISGVFSITGIFIGYKLSNFQWEKQRKIEKRNIATGFYMEINDIIYIIKKIIKYYEDHNMINEFNQPRSAGPYTLNGAIVETKIGLNRFGSLYNENGLYYHFRKEIYLLDTDTVEGLLNFYTELIHAVNLYNIYDGYLFGKNPTKNTDSTAAWNIEDDVIKHMLVASNEVPNLLCLLEVQMNKDNIKRKMCD
ncbi:hypothetical protein MSBRW_1408 [Methanosarcina barkeri str. Wiesmoor]|uniref:Uncharacterized protein n=2 Tax=Methanosarcina barkeri TaxID=2208 RepID=A0A0E3LL51_METBA|nr:hypothetical protein [Methanosarcina barkeri]AKB50661.1 hypothetical protein MSBRW_1408 [Methanosarcina barkeri str. Wiesmoor]